MGNCVPAGLGNNRNKEFQSVMPFPNGTTDAGQASKKKKLSPQKSSKTAPSPLDDDTEIVNVPQQRAEGTVSLDSPEIGKFKNKSESFDQPQTNETVPTNVSVEGNFMQTESQQRRERMADCEFECSRITSYLFVAGYHVATNRDMLRKNGITHIINCSAAVVENAFIHDQSLRYLSLSMVDGRQDDISWFLCDVIQFIVRARAMGGKILIHCEKGISRSCSYAIAYRMWATGDKWKSCFDYVKKGRSICSPNTAFTCNLIELGELLGKDAAKTGAGGNLLFRCAYHLPHDPQTAVLKLCRTSDSRKIMFPATSLLDPKGVFVIRTVSSNDASVQKTADQHRLFLWQGGETTDGTAKKAEILAKKMHGVLTTTDNVEIVKQGEESFEFLSYLLDDGVFSSSDNSLFDDFYDYPPSEEITQQSMRQMEADHTKNNQDIFRTPTPARESSIKGFAEFVEGPMSREMSRETSIRSQTLPQLSRESSTRRGSGVSMDLQAILTRRSSAGAGTLTTEGASRDTSIGTTGPPIASRSVARERSDSKVDHNETDSTSTTNSRRNSDFVSPFSRIPSIQLGDPAASSGAGSPIVEVASSTLSPEQSATMKKRNIPELSIAPKGTLQQMQRVSEGDVNSSDLSSSRLNSSREPTARDEVRGAVGVGGVYDAGVGASTGAGVIPTLLSVKQLSGGSSKIQLPSLQLQKALSPKPAELALNLAPMTSSRTTPSKSTTKFSQQVSTPEPETPPRSQPPGSEDKAKGNKVSPMALNLNESPRSGSRPTSAVNANGHSPLSDRRLSGAAASVLALAHGTSSNSNSTANLHATLPLKVLERSPSSERHPQDVSLPRGPTPIEDLLSPRDHTYSHQTNLLLPAQVDAAYLRPSGSAPGGVFAFTKPLLFQAVLRELPDIPRPGKRPSSAPQVRYEWQAMGVYDDEDLDEGAIFLLLCPSNVHKIWVGDSVNAQEYGIAADANSDDDKLSAANIIKWAAKVLPGEVKVDGSVGAALLENPDVSVEMGGEESEEFWQDFNDGY